ncbi:hypothetical protein [Corynebacterium variabile]|uniref:hypothetical protein n=1 Tax=Corynebacterium variabile TaxID=1727 RepID=UPI002FE33ACA
MATVTQDLIDAADQLDIQPRLQRWRSVTYCALDAVWSIGARYDAVVAPLVRRVAASFSDDHPLTTELNDPGRDPVPLAAFQQRFPDCDSLLEVVRNDQRTSPRGGILKADAALRYGEVLLQNGIGDLAAAQSVLNDSEATARITAALRSVPGRGVRENYFWMLVGANTLVKPDRQVLKWLAEHGLVTSVDGGSAALTDLAEALSERRGTPVSPWELDNAIWRSVARSTARY